MTPAPCGAVAAGHPLSARAGADALRAGGNAVDAALASVLVSFVAEPLLTGPLGPRTRVLRHHVPCSPCFLRECPLDFACMKSITPEAAVAAAEEMLR